MASASSLPARDVGLLRAPRRLTSATRVEGLGSGALITVAWASIAALSLLFGSVRFFANDDVAMAALASGGYSGSPSARLVYVGYLPGLVLAAAYRALPSVPWYVLLLDVAAVTALSTVSWLLWRCRERITPAQVVVLGTTLFTWASLLLMTPTFTIAAFALATASLCILAAAPLLGSAAPTAAVAGGLLLGAAAALRWDSLLGAFAVGAPLAIAAAVAAGRRFTVRFTCTAALTVAVVMASNAVAAAPTAWSRYQAFTSAREDVHLTVRLQAVLDHPADPDVLRMLEANDWSINDARLFTSWIIDDPAVYSTDRLERLDEVSRADRFAPTWSTAWREVVAGRGALVLLVLAAATIAALRGRRAGLLATTQVAWTAAVALLLSREHRFPDRIALPIAMLVALLLTFTGAMSTPSSSWRHRWDTARRGAAMVLAGAVAVGSLLPLWQEHSPLHVSRENRASAALLQRQLDDVRAVDPAGRFVVAAAALPFDSADALEVELLFADRRLLWSSWLSQSPTQVERLRQMGLTSDLLGDLLDAPHRYLVLPHRHREFVRRAYRERRGVDVRLEVVEELGNGTSVYAVRSHSHH